MILHTVYMPKKGFALEDVDDIFALIVSVLEFVIPLYLALITVLIYYSVIPISIAAVVFFYINKTYHKRLPAPFFIIVSVICWLWLAVVALVT